MAKHISLLLFHIWLHSVLQEEGTEAFIPSLCLMADPSPYSSQADPHPSLPPVLRMKAESCPCKRLVRNWHRFSSLEHSAYFPMYLYSYFFSCQRDCQHKVWSSSTSCWEGLEFNSNVCSGFVLCVYFRRARLQSWKKPNPHVPIFPTHIQLFNFTSSLMSNSSHYYRKTPVIQLQVFRTPILF